jgi:hypothetical protein
LKALYLGSGKSAEALEDEFNTLKPKIRSAIAKFKDMQVSMTEKQPSTSELLEWMKVLEVEGFFVDDVDFAQLSDKQKTILQYTLPLLAKSRDDRERTSL